MISLSHTGRDVFLESAINAIAFAKKASRGLSATAEFRVKLSCGQTDRKTHKGRNIITSLPGVICLITVVI